MKLKFSISYNTAWGESMHVDLNYICSDRSVKHYNLAMTTQDGELWSVETAAIESRQRTITAFSYAYQVESADGEVLRREFDIVPRLLPCDSSRDYIMNDSWRDIPLMCHLFTDACMIARETVKAVPLPIFRKTALFRLTAPQLKEGQAVAVCGSHPAMGDWNSARYLPMQYAGQSVWTMTVNVEAMMAPLEYKYVIVDSTTHSFIEWEGGDNRIADFQKVADGEVVVLDGGNLRVREEIWKAAGVVIPVFSLRSHHSYGVGDFGDLRRMVDWAAATGMKIIQTLPVNDTTMQHNWNDSYPYNTISVNALHPQYVDIEAAGELADKAKMNDFYRRRQELNNMQVTDYEAVERVKTEYLHLLFEERKAEILDDGDYRKFVADNQDWLVTYAAFCILRDNFHTARFTDWQEYAKYDRKKTAALISLNSDEAHYIYYVQYLLHTQLLAAADYARSKGVVLMGDIPVGISIDSVEAWAEGGYFNLDTQTGSPPDKVNPNGQNWCFPTYNWDAMMADGCKWWHRRLARMEQYYGAFRIDHVLGFFRIWEIPDTSVDGLLGHFSPAMPMDKGEIERYGLPFHHELYTKPFINDRVLNKVFGIHAQYVRDNFLVPKAYNLYDLREEYSTQKKIRDMFGGRRDENSLWIRDGLYRLAADVLFIEDKRQLGRYHPRVRAYNEPIYEALNTEDRSAFMRLYNDYYYERHNMMWGSVAMRRLSAVLRGTRMLACAEDLGQLPDCVAPVLDALRILTLEVQTLPKERGYEFAHLEGYPYRSMATISTHDMPPMRQWWEEMPDRTQRYYAAMMQKEGRAPEQLSALLAEEIITRHMYCPSMMCVLSFQDWMAMDAELRSKNVRQERINVPGDCYNRWQYRMHITIEQLLAETRFNQKLKTLIERSKRGSELS